MIDRMDYSLLMHVLIEEAADAKEFDDFADRMTRLIITSYEINDPEHGRVDVIDVTDEIREGMGRHWSAFADFGIENIQFVTFLLMDKVILETGRMLGPGEHAEGVDVALLLNLSEDALKAFAKAMTLSMRKHDVQMLKRLIEDTADGDALGLGQLIQQFLEEEIDETVAKFSSQLDAVFGVASVVQPWSPPAGPRKDEP